MQGFTALDLVVVLVYLVGIAWLGLAQARRVRTPGDYFAGGRKFNKWLMMMHALGTGTHADDPVGVAGAAYQRGVSGIWYTYIYLFCTPFYWIIAPVFRRSRFLTTADFFKARFSRALGLLYAIMGVLIFSINIGTMLKGTGTIATSVTGGALPEWVAIVLMTAVFVAYGTAGGLVATVITESIQGLLIVVMSALLIPYGLARVGGFAAIHSVLTPDKFSLAGPDELTMPWILAASVAALIGIVAQPHTMEVCAAGKTEWEGRVGFTYGSFVKRLCAMGWALTGVVVLALVATGRLPGPLAKREEAFGVAIRELLPSGMTGLMFAAILAAQMSTLSAFMVAGSALLSRNIYRDFLRPQTTDEQTVKVGRWAGLLVVGLGVGFAFSVSGVADALTWFWGLNSLLGVLMWAAVLWRGANARGAWLSFATMALAWLWLGPVGAKLAAHWPGLHHLGAFGDKKQLHLLLVSYLPAGVAALVVGSLLSSGRPGPTRGAWLTLAAIGAAGLALSFVGSHGKGPWAEVLRQLPTAGFYAALAAGLAAIAARAAPVDTDVDRRERFYRLLGTPVGREAELEAAGVEVVYSGETTGHPWELQHPRLVNGAGFVVGVLFSCAILGLLWALAGLGAH